MGRPIQYVSGIHCGFSLTVSAPSFFRRITITLILEKYNERD
ncbi:hypothetical protein [Shigella phage ESh22]|nr:hypothetical protein [Shigella phage ESh19]URY12533.1 hypothetical protein [Shigella phage ESh20]URY12667.1 hypothetical protein [Shigella phage ESh21]URY12872.1 hypothetical protein [Shigella phage ESh22]